MIPIIKERRAALAAQAEQAKATYDQLEATLKELDRQILAMHGGLLELDQLLAELALLDGDAIPEERTAESEPPIPDR